MAPETMSTQEERRIKSLLTLHSFDLPPLKVVDYDCEIVEDSSGDVALEIVVVLDDSTTDEQIRHAPIHEIKNKIADRLIEEGVKYFPYISFERVSEYEPSE